MSYHFVLPMNLQYQVCSYLFRNSLTTSRSQSGAWSSAVYLHLFPPLHFHSHQTSPVLISIPVFSLSIFFPHSTYDAYYYLVNFHNYLNYFSFLLKKF